MFRMVKFVTYYYKARLTTFGDCQARHNHNKAKVFDDTTKSHIQANAYKEKIEYDMKNGHHKDVTFFVSKVAPDVKVTRQVEEINSFGWFDYQQAYDKLTYDNLKQLLKSADEYIRNKEGIGD